MTTNWTLWNKRKIEANRSRLRDQPILGEHPKSNIDLVSTHATIVDRVPTLPRNGLGVAVPVFLLLLDQLVLALSYV